MRKIICCGMCCSALVAASCIFQNNPLGPNQPPTIESYTPTLTFFTLTAPDSCSFLLRAVDPDGDEIRYAYLLGDSLLSARDSLTFFALRAGEYTIRGEAWDAAAKAKHEWHVTVFERNNVPPEITSSYPEQSRVACAVGQTLEFHFTATDDHPEALQYSYLLDSALLHAGSPDLINRFMQRGEFLLEGIAWDGQHGDTVRWDVSVTGYPDTLSPGTIRDLAGGPGDLDGTIGLEWTAPGDDGDEGTVASYIVRTSTYPIVTEDDWRDAEGKVGEPIPSPAGSRERMTIRNLVSASYVYVTLRAVDDFFNLSPLGNCIKVLARGVDVGGRVVNAATNEPIPGIVVLTSLKADTTDANGNYTLVNVPSYTTAITARDESSYGVLGAYYDRILPIGSITQYIQKDFHLLPVFGLVNVVEPNIYGDSFLNFFRDITKSSGDLGVTTVYKGWNHWPVTVYNPPKMHGDLDLQAAASAAMTDWEERTLCDLFLEVSEPENADVLIIYDDVSDDRHHVTTTERNADGTPKTRELWIYTPNTEVPLSTHSQMVYAHELGHVIGLDHSRNIGHLLIALTTPQVDHATTDETRVVQAVYHMPNIFDSKTFIND